jgi:hypothetical protein
MLCLAMSEQQNGQTDDADTGQWLPLTEAARVLAISESVLQRLITSGALRTREQDGGQSEIWVADAGRAREAAPQTLEIVEREPRLPLVERMSTMIHHPVEALLAPMAASYERNIQLARENGALSARVASLERELQATRDAAAAEKKDLEVTRARLRAIETNSAQLEARLNTQAERQLPERGRRRSWLLLILVVLLALVLGVAWFALWVR